MFLLILVDSVPGLIGLRPVLPWLLFIVILEATAQTNLDVLLLKTWASDSELGVYDRTQHLMRVPLSLSVNFVDRVAGSSYSRAQRSVAEIRRSIFQFAIFMTVGVAVGLVAIQLFLWFFADLTLDGVGEIP